jgi:hypothetical protein
MQHLHWDDDYRLRYLENVGENRVARILSPIRKGTILLVRYCENKPAGMLPQKRYWTEFITDVPQYASEGTGIGVHICKWRIEWTFPAALAADLVGISERQRASSVGWFYEYRNLVPVDVSDCRIFEMNPVGAK